MDDDSIAEVLVLNEVAECLIKMRGNVCEDDRRTGGGSEKTFMCVMYQLHLHLDGVLEHFMRVSVQRRLHSGPECFLAAVTCRPMILAKVSAHLCIFSISFDTNISTILPSCWSYLYGILNTLSPHDLSNGINNYSSSFHVLRAWSACGDRLHVVGHEHFSATILAVLYHVEADGDQ